MTKPVKSELIRVLEEKLEFGYYSCHHQTGSAFLLLFVGYPLLVCSAYQIHSRDVHGNGKDRDPMGPLGFPW